MKGLLLTQHSGCFVFPLFQLMVIAAAKMASSLPYLDEQTETWKLNTVLRGTADQWQT